MHLAPGHWAGHMRIYHRECMALVEAGYSVELIAHTLGQEELDPRIRLHSLGDYGKPTLALRLWERAQRSQRAYTLCRKSNAVLHHFYSPEFILWAIRLRHLTRRPLIFDCMEDFEGYSYQRRGIPNRLRRLVALLVRSQLKLAARNCDAMILSDQGTADKFRPYAKRLLVLHNFPRLELFQTSLAESSNKLYDLVYHGSIPRYHLEVCLSIDQMLVEYGFRVRWRLIGQLPDIDWFTEQLRRRGIRERFFISGLIPHDQIAREVSKAKIGIIPLPSLPKFQNNIPQKIFEFMALGMPMVLSDLPPSRPFVGDGACAFMVPPDDYVTFAKAVVRLLNDPGLCRSMGTEGRRRIEKDYNWEKESRKLIDLYTELLAA